VSGCFCRMAPFTPSRAAWTRRLKRFDDFLALAEEAGLYVQPTGPDHWEGTPEWARGDRLADERILAATVDFWRLFAARYRGRTAIMAYELLNEPEVAWDTPAMRGRWCSWLKGRYDQAEQATKEWGLTLPARAFEDLPPPGKGAAPGKYVLDYQRCREDIADGWTRRQVEAIRAADPGALVTVGLIQWSVPVWLGGPGQYSGFRPENQSRLLDLLEIHFYPLADGFYEYRGEADERRNLACLECVTREAARWHKPVLVGEFGWYGGGKPAIDAGRHPFATGEQQARWCRRAVEVSSGWAAGWLNWGVFDHPGAGDVTEWTGMLTAQGAMKPWGESFRELAGRFGAKPPATAGPVARPVLDWDLNLTDPRAVEAFRNGYFEAYAADHRR